MNENAFKYYNSFKVPTYIFTKQRFKKTCDIRYIVPKMVNSKDLYQVQETWKLVFLTYIQLCLLKPIFRMSKVLSEGSTYFKDIHFNFLFMILHENYLKF